MTIPALGMGVLSVPRFRSVASVPPWPQEEALATPSDATPVVGKSRLGRKISFFAKIAGSSLLALLVPNKTVRYWAEKKALFQQTRPASPDELTSALLKKYVQVVSFPATDGTRLQGWFVPPRFGKPTLVYSYGTSSKMTDAEYFLDPAVRDGYGILTYDYRGYGHSEGSPTEAGLSMDLEGASDFLVGKGIPHNQQILVGMSLGSGVTVDVASRRPNHYKAVVLLSAATNIPQVYASIKKRLKIPRFLFRLEDKIQHRFDSLSKIGRIQSPVLLVHGQRDTLAPYNMAEQLFDAATTLKKQLVPVPDGRHFLLKKIAKGLPGHIEKWLAS